MAKRKGLNIDPEIPEDAQFDGAGNPIAPRGHNRPPRPGGVAVDQLRSIVERVEKLEEEKAGIAADIRDVFYEAKGNGFDVKTLRKILALRKQDAHERAEQEALLDTYKHALGMIPDLEDGREELNDYEDNS